MRKLLVPIFIFAVVVLGYAVYQDNQLKKRQEVDQLIQNAHQSLKIVDGNTKHTDLASFEMVDSNSSESLRVKSNQF